MQPLSPCACCAAFLISDALFSPPRFAEVERTLQANAGEMAALREMGESIAEYRSTLDVARCGMCWLKLGKAIRQGLLSSLMQ